MPPVPVMPQPAITPDGAELTILAEATKNGIMAFPLGSMPNAMMQMAHERLVINEYLRLIDIQMVINPNSRQPEPARVFKITAEGRKRLMELRISAK